MCECEYVLARISIIHINVHSCCGVVVIKSAVVSIVGPSFAPQAVCIKTPSCTINSDRVTETAADRCQFSSSRWTVSRIQLYEYLLSAVHEGGYYCGDLAVCVAVCL